MEPMSGPTLWSRIQDVRVWRVLLVYAGASWAILEATDFFIEKFGLPDWFLPAALVLLLIGMAVFISTAMVQAQAAGLSRSVAESSAEPSSTEHEPEPSSRRLEGLRRLLTWRNAILGGVTAFALWGVVAAAWLLLATRAGTGAGDRTATASAGHELTKLVVLPFESLSGEEDDYFAAGITDAITARLAMLEGLGIISRQSAIQYANSQKRASEIGAELDVEYILEGTVQRERPGDPDSPVRVIPQLVRISDDTHLWAATYDEEMEEVFRVQSEIAERVARALDVTLHESQRRAIEARPSDDLEAYDFYLRGKEYLDRAGLEFLDRAPLTAVEFFQKAVEQDPEFAEAWAALAHAHLQAIDYGHDIGADRLELARVAAERALALDPDLADAHVAMSWYRKYRGDWDVALWELQRAREIKPGDALVLRGIAEVHRRRGELEEAMRTAQRVVELDPRSVGTVLWYSNLLEWTGRYAEALEQIDRAITLAPDRIVPYGEKVGYYLMQGDTGAARRVVEMGSDRLGRVAFVTNLLSWDYYPFRILPELREPLARLSVASFGHDTVSHYFYHMARGWQERLAGGGQAARAHYDSARVILEDRVRRSVDPDFDLRVLAEANAGSDRGAEAIATARRALERASTPGDLVDRLDGLLALARVHAMLGQADEAIARLRELAELGPVRRAKLRVDPVWDSIRTDPRFQALAAAPR